MFVRRYLVMCLFVCVHVFLTICVKPESLILQQVSRHHVSASKWQRKIQAVPSGRARPWPWAMSPVGSEHQRYKWSQSVRADPASQWFCDCHLPLHHL